MVFSRNSSLTVDSIDGCANAAASASEASSAAFMKLIPVRGSFNHICSKFMTYDSAVVGAGVFGAWTAHALARAGHKVLLIDAYGPANARASSGGESRLIRMGYGADEIYTRMAKRSLELWKDLFARTGRPLFHETGILWLARDDDPRLAATVDVLSRNGIPHEKLSQQELSSRYPHMRFDEVAWGVLEPQSGALLARRAVQAVVDDAVAHGVEYRTEAWSDRLTADRFIFACGAWLPKAFPGTPRQSDLPHATGDLLLFGPPKGDTRYAPPATPGWLHSGDLYGFPIWNRAASKWLATGTGRPPIRTPWSES